MKTPDFFRWLNRNRISIVAISSGASLTALLHRGPKFPGPREPILISSIQP